MNSKERVKAVLNFQKPDMIPYGEYAIDSDTVQKVIGHETYLRAKAKTQLALWAGRRDEVVQSLKEDMILLYEKLDCIDIVNLMSEACGLVPPRDYTPLHPKKIGDGKWEDNTGKIYKYSDTTRDITMVYDPHAWDPEYTPEEFDLNEVLTPPDPSQFEVICHVANHFKDSRYVIGYAGREAGMVLLGGMERGLTEYLTNPEGVAAAIASETRKGNFEDRYWIQDNLDAVIWGQDFAYNTGSLLNPALFRELILPSIKSRVENIKRNHGIAVFKHCCGNTAALSGMFLEAGYDCYQSIQKQAGLSLPELQGVYKNKMCLWGGVDVATLIAGSMEDVRKETSQALAAAKQGGIILGSSHSIATGCNYNNYMAMLDVLTKERSLA